MNIGDVTVSVEGKRGCGFRKAGGLYLVAPQLSNPCGKLPIILQRCPTCGEGISFSRAPRWVEPQKLIEAGPCAIDQQGSCNDCPAGRPTILGDRALLIWIGEKHYATPAEFSKEACEVGVSRRVKSVPRNFVVGTTWVLLAHPKVRREDCHCMNKSETAIITDPDCPDCDGDGFVDLGGIFTVFRPRAVEYVCRGDETEEELEKIVKRGLTPVIVKRKGDTAAMPFEDGDGGDVDGTEE